MIIKFLMILQLENSLADYLMPAELAVCFSICSAVPNRVLIAAIHLY